MKKFIFSAFIALIVVLLGCNSNKQISNTGNVQSDTEETVNDTIRIANDELEYEVIIIDPGFNYWLQSRARQRGYYEQSYFEIKNRLWIMEWNTRVMNPGRYNDLYQMRIDYDPKIDYGYEVNYLIYNYLVYFQQTNNQQLGGIVPQF